MRSFLLEKNFILAACCLSFVICLLYLSYKSGKERCVFDDDQYSVGSYRPDRTSRKSFVKKQEYEFKIFFVESVAEHVSLDYKQLCAIESAALWNPTALVQVYYLNAVDTHGVLNGYSNIQFVKFDVEDFFQDEILKSWWKSSRQQVLKSPHAYSHLTDLMRIYLLWKHGGVYADLDTITVRNLKRLFPFPGLGKCFEWNSESLNGAVLVFPMKSDPTLYSAILEFKHTYEPRQWGFNGPMLFRRLLTQMCQSENIYADLAVDPDDEYAFSSSPEAIKPRKCSISLYPKETFYPIDWEQSSMLFQPNSNIPINLFKKAYVIHFFNKVSSEHQFTGKENNIYEFFARFNCPLTFDRVRRENP